MHRMTGLILALALSGAAPALAASADARELHWPDDYCAAAATPALRDACMEKFAQDAGAVEDEAAGAVDPALLAWWAAVAETLAGDADVRRRILGLQIERLLPSGDAPPVDPDRLAGLAAAAGDDPLALQMMLNALPDGATALRRELAARLAVVAPTSLAALVHALAAAQGDGEASDRILMSTRLPEGPVEAYAALHGFYADVLAGHPLPASLQREAPAAIVDALIPAIALPPMMPLSRACGSTGLPHATARRAACVTIARALALEGETALSRSVGFGLWSELNDDPEVEQAIALARRTMDWQTFHSTLLLDDDHVRWRRLLQRPGTSEMDAVASLLAEAGIAAEPPPEWRSWQERLAAQ